MKLNASRISRVFFLVCFFFLFVTTDYRGKDEISVALNSFFRMDPLVALSSLLSTKTFTILLLPGLVLLVCSAMLGRFFCGWMCPMGSVIDIASKRMKKGKPPAFLKGRLKYYVLFIVLFAALFNMNLAGLLDPMAIFVRFLTFAFYPLLGFLGREGWAGLYGLLGDSRDYLDPGYTFLKSYLLPFRDTFYPLALVSLFFFLGVLVLEKFERRSWCRNLCPLGTLLGLTGRLSFFRRLPVRLCADCGDCRDHCPAAFDGDSFQESNCIRCIDCQRMCSHDRVRFRASLRRGKNRVFSPGRRVFMAGAASLASGLFVSRVLGKTTAVRQTQLLRPPGVLREEDFLDKCVRCGECMKVCLRSALYPASLQTGLYSLYTPMVVPRLGYCEYNCSLCGQVCPTGAIPKLPLDQKKKAVIGLAVIDKNHCLPHAKKMNCMVCEEHCPVPDKAIRFGPVRELDYNGKAVVLKKPYVVDDLCIGCGICEYVCPLEEKAGIEVFKKTKKKL